MWPCQPVPKVGDHCHWLPLQPSKVGGWFSIPSPKLFSSLGSIINLLLNCRGSGTLLPIILSRLTNIHYDSDSSRQIYPFVTEVPTPLLGAPSTARVTTVNLVRKIWFSHKVLQKLARFSNIFTYHSTTFSMVSNSFSK